MAQFRLASPRHDPHPLRSQPHRLPAHRRRPHRALQLGVRAPPRRQVHPAHRGHRPRALDAGIGAGHPRRDALARPRLGRGPVLPDAAPRRATRKSPSSCWRRARRTAATATKEELDAMREAQTARGEKPRYDRRWRESKETPPAGRTPVLRFKNPISRRRHLERCREGTDHGLATMSSTTSCSLRADGVPTYNFGVVVDDIDMAMTHVIRGDDHVNNTPRQINLYRALGAELPHFGHVPMILGSDGQRLSKRHGAVNVMQYHDDGYPRRRDGELPRAAGLVARRRGSVLARAIGRVVRPRAREQVAGALGLREAEVDERRVPEARSPTPTLRTASRKRSPRSTSSWPR